MLKEKTSRAKTIKKKNRFVLTALFLLRFFIHYSWITPFAIKPLGALVKFSIVRVDYLTNSLYNSIAASFTSSSKISKATVSPFTKSSAFSAASTSLG